MKKKIAIVVGGDSGEYEVSINSGNVVKNNLDPELFESYVVVFKKQSWSYFNGDEKVELDKNDFSLTLNGKKILFDAVFIAIHGTPGEDGKLQGYLEMLEIPFTSCNSIVSGLTFDKDLTKEIVKQWGVMVPDSVMIKEGETYDTKLIIENLGLPCFVKPNKGGSSVGMTKVKQTELLDEAIKLAFTQDNEVLVEAFVGGREITCGVYTSENELIVLPITEIISKKEYFDYEAKYEGQADEITPAEVEEETDSQCKLMSSFLYRNLKCKGVVRFDYIYNKNGMYFLEVNTVPGLSEASIVPQQASEMGISIRELFTTLINESLN